MPHMLDETSINVINT